MRSWLPMRSLCCAVSDSRPVSDFAMDPKVSGVSGGEELGC